MKIDETTSTEILIKKCEEYEGQIKGLKSENTYHINMVHNYAIKVEELGDEVDTLEYLCEKRDDTIYDLEEENEELRTEIYGFECEVEDLNTEIGELGAEVEDLESEISDLRGGRWIE